MKKVSLLALALIASVCTLWAQQLEPTGLGKWTKPASVGIAAVDSYIDHCAGMYGEAMELRKQYEAIDTLTVNVGEAMAIAENNGETVKAKVAEYEALLKRVEAQQGDAAKLPAMAESAAKAVPVGLKAVAATKAITSTKEAVRLAVSENASLLKAITAQITTLSTAPTQSGK